MKVKTVSQLLHFNVKTVLPDACNLRHSVDREPNIPAYIGLKIHNDSRDRGLCLICEFASTISAFLIWKIYTKRTFSVCKGWTCLSTTAENERIYCRLSGQY